MDHNYYLTDEQESARYYNTGIGRFTQEDVIYNDGLNLYAYCSSNSVMYSDPSGYAEGSVKPKPCMSKDSGSKANIYDRTGYQSNGRSNNLFERDRSTRRTTNLTEWRSLDGTRQFRVKPDDYLGKHGIGRPTIPNIPHVHYELLISKSNGNGFDVIKNIHVPIK